ncbi:MAG: DNA mismatch repair endonuclease MutL [Gammaproteobacteria bacterium]|nr:DNA mismatch repair endonuclease MutL [Gammaproteobacteria bacterium]
MPARIQALPEHVINQIAAGEVIERPASVIKELVENALDAGASRIEVEVVEGGLESMTVSDDGCGIRGAELGAALKRHWTSKISRAQDLAALTSLGFRGEALASIAAVATVEIVTRERDEPHGWRLLSLPGQAPAPPTPHQANPGTRITVRELFHCVPARRRFLKRARTEFLHIHQLVRQLAFARPEVALSLAQPGSRGLRFAPGALGLDGPRWRALFGSAFLAGARPVSQSADGLEVRGWVGAAALADSQSDSQFLALNGRYVRDRQLAHAVRLAFGDALPAGRFPVYALALALDPGAVDVNVHPGKLEVRFVELRAVHDLLYAAVRRTLEDDAPEPPPPAREVGETRADAQPLPAPARAASVGRGTVEPPTAWRQPALALVDERFVLFRDGGAVRCLDLRATWEAVLSRRLAATDGEPRPLLVPERVSLSATEVETLVDAGFDIDDLGPAGQRLRAVPRVLPNLAWGAFCAAFTRAPRRAPGAAMIAAAAAAALELGRDGMPSRRLLDELAQAAAAAGFDLRGAARVVDAALLARASADER